MTTSRLEHYERVRLIRQTFLFFGLAVGSGLLFLFVILPLFIRILALKNVGSKLASDETTIPPQSPSLQQPFTATNSAQITLRGSAPSGLSVRLLHNGIDESQTTAADDGTFVFSVLLSAGENSMQAIAEDASGLRSNPSNDVRISLVTDAPKLEISEPLDGAVFTQFKQKVLRVAGMTNPGNKITINDQFVFVANDGSFAGSIQLANGQNKILIKAQDPASNESVKELTVSYTP